MAAENSKRVFRSDIKTWRGGLCNEFTYLPACHDATFPCVGNNDGFVDLVKVFQQHFFCSLHINNICLSPGAKILLSCNG